MRLRSLIILSVLVLCCSGTAWQRASQSSHFAVMAESHRANPELTRADIVTSSRRSLSAQCLSPEGDPVAGAKICGFGRSENGIWDVQTIADHDGRFQIVPPVNHDCELLIYSERFAPTRVRISRDQKSLGEIRLASGRRIRGIVKDRNGHPVIGALIAIYGMDRGEMMGLVNNVQLAVKSLDGGCFETPPLTGRYVLATPRSVSVQYPTAMEFTSDAGMLGILPVTVNCDVAENSAIVALNENEVQELGGILADVKGRPISGARVTLNLRTVGTLSAEFDSAETDHQGRYCFANVPIASSISISIFGQPNQNGGYDIPVPIEPTTGATTQPNILSISRVTNRRSDLDWQMQHKSLSAKETTENVTALSQEHHELVALIQALRDHWKLSISKKIPPAGDRLDDLLRFANSATEPDCALTALRTIIETGGKSADQQLRAGRDRAFEVLVRRFLDHPDVDLVLCRSVTRGIPSLAVLKQLEAIAIRSPHIGVQAMARLELAEFYLNISRITQTDESSSPATSQTKKEISESLEKDIMNSVREVELSPEQAILSARKELVWLTENVPEVTLPSVYGCSDEQGMFLHRSQVASTRTFGYVARHLQQALEKLGLGQEAPELIGTTIDGRQFSLGNQKGRVVVVIFTAGWCQPCRAEWPAIRRFMTRIAKQPVDVIGISGDHDRNQLEKAHQLGEINWPTIWDGGLEGKLVERWNVHSWPTIVVIDQRGKIANSKINAASLPSLIDDLLSRE